MADPKLSVHSCSLLLPARRPALLRRAREAASLGSDAQNMSGGGRGVAGAAAAAATPQKKRCSSYDGDVERLRCSEMTKSTSPRSAAAGPKDEA